MIKSRFANVVHLENEYLIHNTLYGGVIKANCNDSKSLLRAIHNGEYIKFNEREEFHQTLRDMRMIVEDDMNESSLVNFHFLQRQQYELNIILIVTRQSNFRCIYC